MSIVDTRTQSDFHKEAFVFNNTTAFYAKDGIDAVATTGRALVERIRSSGTTLEDARSDAQKVVEQFDEVVGTPAMTAALCTYHQRIAVMELAKIADTMESNIEVLVTKHAEMINLDRNYASRF